MSPSFMQQSLSQKPLKKKNERKCNTQPLSVRIQTSEKYNTHIPVLKNRLFGLKVTVQW